jgi:hypothetical protein
MADDLCWELIYPSGEPFTALGFEDAEIGCYGSKKSALEFAHQGVDDKAGIPMARQRTAPCVVLRCVGCGAEYDEDEGMVHFRDRAQAWDCAAQIGWHVDGHETLCEACKPQPPAPALTDPCDGQEPLFWQVVTDA